MNPAAVAALAKGDIDNAIVASTPGGIERQEAAAQATLVASTDMPIELLPSKEAFELVGFTFGENVDDIFQKATLPVGWTRKATEHSMHSDIVDEKGRRRVGVFYKGAFYDRRASAYLAPRFEIRSVYGDDDKRLNASEMAHAVLDNATGQKLFLSPACKGDDWDAQDASRKACEDWLKANYPKSADPCAHWDD